MQPDEQEHTAFDIFFPHGTDWVRADFHLHTRADKEFRYDGDDNQFVTAYVAGLKAAGIRLGVITNHNKFDFDEFKALRRVAKKEGIGLLPGVELSVADGANGVHTLVVFSDRWLEGGEDYINMFLANTFDGKTRGQYEQENARSNDDLVNTLTKLDKYNRDFFVVFAHVEAASGLWRELKGGRLQELSNNPLVQKYTLGFQKVRSHDKPDEPCRIKVRQWWPLYPAELEGSDPKRIEEIGKGKPVFLKIGDLTFDAVKFALKDFEFRVAEETPKVGHSYVKAVRFEGGLFDGVRIPFSTGLNCLIGIQGSGKSSALECLRYALDIPFGDKPQDREYKERLIPFVLQSGGKVVVEAVDQLGSSYEVRRIWGHAPEVFVNRTLRPGISIRESVVRKPLYFGQKDLSAAGQGFGQDLVEKLVGDSLTDIRSKISSTSASLRKAVADLKTVHTDTELLAVRRAELTSLEYQIEQFDKHGVNAKLEKQLAYNQDAGFVATVEEKAEAWQAALDKLVADEDEAVASLAIPVSKYNADFFARFAIALDALKATIQEAKKLSGAVEAARATVAALRDELTTTTDGLTGEFAQTMRELLDALSEKGITSLQPDDYVQITTRKTTLEEQIADLVKSTEKKRAREEAVAAFVSALNEAWLEEYKATSLALNKINVAQTELQIKPTFKGDKAAFANRLEQALKGSNVRREHIDTICSTYVDFAAIYAKLDEAAAIARGRSDAFKEYFERSLSDLLSFQIPNTYEVTYHGRPLKSHSLGQRASAMMLFLLTQTEHDLILIDQPEDDLDSQTVYEEVVKRVRKIKAGRQFIFATHNANFPVLGDAESVSSFSASDEAIVVETASIDTEQCQRQIVKIMEGGPEAFARRKTIYEIWRLER